MDYEHIRHRFIRYYNNDTILRTLAHNTIYLYYTCNLTIEWHVVWNSLIVSVLSDLFVISSDKPCEVDKKREILNCLEVIQELKWNEIGEPVKHDLLNYLYQLHQLDIPLTKPAK